MNCVYCWPQLSVRFGDNVRPRHSNQNRLTKSETLPTSHIGLSHRSHNALEAILYLGPKAQIFRYLDLQHSSITFPPLPMNNTILLQSYPRLCCLRFEDLRLTVFILLAQRCFNLGTLGRECIRIPTCTLRVGPVL